MKMLFFKFVSKHLVNTVAILRCEMDSGVYFDS